MMADKYKKQLLTEYHKLNHTKVIKYAYENIKNYIPIGYQIELRQNNYNNLGCGVYRFVDDKRSYLFALDKPCKKVIIENHHHITATSNGKSFAVVPYLVETYDVSAKRILPNTVNSFIDRLIICGKTELDIPNGIGTQSPENPARMRSIDQIDARTSSTNGYENDSMSIRLYRSLRSLPSGIKDTFILDGLAWKCYSIHRVGDIITTGQEDWIYQQNLSTTKFSVFFLQCMNIRIGEDDTSIQCNYLPSITYSTMINNKSLLTGISNSNDPTKQGIYIRVPASIAHDESELRNFMEERFKTNPFTIHYLMTTYQIKTTVLEHYWLKTYYPETRIIINHNTDIGCCVNVFKDHSTLSYDHFVVQALETRL